MAEYRYIKVPTAGEKIGVGSGKLHRLGIETDIFNAVEKCGWSVE